LCRVPFIKALSKNLWFLAALPLLAYHVTGAELTYSNGG
jgi:hypothetical protein